MPFPNQLPAPVSHLKARLRSLKRPMVWGPAIIIGLIVLFTLEYWLNPEWFNAKRNVADDESGFNPSLSSEDSAIGADIDSLPLLLQQINGEVTTPTDPSSETAATTENPGLFDWFAQNQKQLEGDATANNSSTPGSTIAKSSQPGSSSLLAEGITPSPRTSSQSFTTPSFTGVKLANPTSSASSSAATSEVSVPSFIPDLNLLDSVPPTTNLLQSALEKNRGTNNSTTVQSSPVVAPSTAPLTEVAAPTSGAIAPAISAPSSGFPSTTPGTINYNTAPLPDASASQNSFNYLTSPSGTSGVGSVPTVPTVPSAPVAPVVPNNNFGQSFGQPTTGAQPQSGFTGSGFSSTIGTPPTSTVPSSPRPFSAPRRVPGRYIGGGEINTFSNP